MRLAVLVLALCCSFAAVAAQNGKAPASAPQLEDLLTREQYDDLSRAFAAITAPDEILLLINWQEAKVLDGDGAFLAFEYSKTLERAARAFPTGLADFRESGATYLVYAYALTAIDGAACEHPDGPQAFAQAISQSPLWRTIAEMSPDHAGFLIESALDMEKALSDKRRGDGHLCGGAPSFHADFAARQAIARSTLAQRVTAIVDVYKRAPR